MPLSSRAGAEGAFVLSKVCRGHKRHWQGAWALSSPLGPWSCGFPPQLAHPYRTMVLRAMETVVSTHISELDKATARAVILLAFSEMTKARVRGHRTSPLAGLPTAARGDMGLAPILPTDHLPGRGELPVILAVESKAENSPLRVNVGPKPVSGGPCPSPVVEGQQPGVGRVSRSLTGAHCPQ